MLHVRIVAPSALASRVLKYLLELETAINVVHLRDVAAKPSGDLVTCDVPREDGSVVLRALSDMGCGTDGTMTVDPIGVSLSVAAHEAERRAVGAAAEAVIWEEVEAHTTESADLSFSYLLFMVLAALIAAVGIVTDSVVLIVGAMVVSPEFGPLAGLCVALLQRRPALAGRSALAIVAGFAAAIGAALLFTFVLVQTGMTPPGFGAAHPQTMFISRPDVYSAIIAATAGVAGMYSLTTAKPAALIGVFISITTLPAAANLGVAVATSNSAEARGAALQLAINLATIVVAGTGTLALQRLAFVRRWQAALRRARLRAAPMPRRPRRG